MCPTKPLMIHLVRGVIGIALLITAVSLAGSLPLVALLLGGGALVAFRGCPTCWLAGLFEVALTKNPAPPAAVPVHPHGNADGPCTLRRGLWRSGATAGAAPRGDACGQNLDNQSFIGQCVEAALQLRGRLPNLTHESKGESR